MLTGYFLYIRQYTETVMRIDTKSCIDAVAIYDNKLKNKANRCMEPPLQKFHCFSNMHYKLGLFLFSICDCLQHLNLSYF
jgi:hypothetical protein